MQVTFFVQSVLLTKLDRSFFTINRLHLPLALFFRRLSPRQLGDKTGWIAQLLVML
jgi:hypothetical protein